MIILKKSIFKKAENSPRRISSGGFTLPEILITLGIIALLLVAAFPALRGVMAKSQGVRCINNLKHLHVGIMAYASDHQQQMPTDYDNSKNTVMSWYRPLVFQGYVPHPVYGPHAYSAKLIKAGPLFCPSNPAPLNVSPWTNYAINSNLYPGGYNLAQGFDERKTMRLSAIRSSCVLLIDSYQSGGKPWDTWYIQAGGKNNPSWTFTDALHSERVNVLFVDGHVESPKVLPRVINSVTKDLGELKSEWFIPVF